VACATRAPPWKTLAAQFITYRPGNSVQSNGASSEVNGLIAEKINPNDKKRAARVEITFGELFDTYLERHAKVHKKTWKEDLGKFNNFLARKEPNYVPSNERRKPEYRLESPIAPEAGSLASKRLSGITRLDIANLVVPDSVGEQVI